ncbi:multidrug efflux SMR transporter [Gracilibacillus sp. S3-1-1]|uniref:Multidrug efflux SMR transporter n=1 Tax=Gracilibacillus pellucidus TaxID=3095368 RepID=A0ACC6M1Z1_9BACI|nr:multidrug efflux SMR transporter [Gracilibacillus sp. S3-1-1]MDX8044965.1 multidrug efflux SMR transporter [Gracilibacillus sp. S3-1-1]
MWWFFVVLAGLIEVGWATGLKYANDGFTWTLTAIAIIISFGGLIIASTRLPASTVYAVFVGVGTLGTVLVDIIFFEAEVNVGVWIFVLLLLTGVIGLKTVTTEKQEQKEVQRP